MIEKGGRMIMVFIASALLHSMAHAADDAAQQEERIIKFKRKFIDPRALLVKYLEGRYSDSGPNISVTVSNNVIYPVKVQFINEGVQADTINITPYTVGKGETDWQSWSDWKTIEPSKKVEFEIPIYYVAEKNFVAQYNYTTTFIRVRMVNKSSRDYFVNKLVKMRDVVSHGAHYHIKNDPESGLTAKRERGKLRNPDMHKEACVDTTDATDS